MNYPVLRFVIVIVLLLKLEKFLTTVFEFVTPLSPEPLSSTNPNLSSSLFAVEFLFLLWGIRLCIMVRKAPSEFNESRFISMTIYNEFLLSIFLNVSV